MRDMPPDLGSVVAQRQEASHADAPVFPAGTPVLPAIEVRLARPRTAMLLPPDIGFLVSYGFTPDDLAAAAARATRLGVGAHQVMIASGAVNEAVYVRLLARRMGATLAGREARPDPRVVLADALRQGWFRASMPDGHPVLVVRASGPVVRALLGAPALSNHAALAVAGEADFHAMLASHFSGEIALVASATVPEAESARTGTTWRQRLILAICAGLLALVAMLWPGATLVLLPMALGVFFLGSALVQLVACAEGAASPHAPKTRVDAVTRDDAVLPRYSVLVPLYREAEVVPDLVMALAQLDYPAEKLQVLLVVEAHDQDTQHAIRAIAMPPNFAMFVAPPGTPHTKPRAINAAMTFATGELVVVYDAEDRPEPDQLRAAVAGFAKAPARVVCLQARLCIDNTVDSWLTRLFTIEYAALFDVIKAGTARLGLPVPLGGTSNHFRSAPLRAIGMWDAWNVTEDADLGFRLALHGLEVQDLSSTTFEEAPHALGPWLHQRSRWLKGWMQTIVSHSRAPVAAWRAMGSVNFFAAVAQSAGVITGAMGAPLFHTLVALRLMAPEPFGSGDFTNRLADAIIIVLGIAGLLATFVPALIGIARRGLWHLLPWVPLLPLYQLLVSVAAYRAFWEFLRSPHSWNKTRHGVARNRAAQPGAGQRDQKQAVQAETIISAKTVGP